MITECAPAFQKYIAYDRKIEIKWDTVMTIWAKGTWENYGPVFRYSENAYIQETSDAGPKYEDKHSG